MATERLEEFIEIPMGLGKRQEPVIRGKGVPVWVLVSYAKGHNMTPEQISELWEGYITPEEVEAAIEYQKAYPERVDDKLKDDTGNDFGD